MKNYRAIDNTKYIIKRVFAENKTAAVLIEQRIKNIKNNAPPLEVKGTMMYNINGGSIRHKEEL